MLCGCFPALTPFSVRRERFRDVLTLFVRCTMRTKREQMRKLNGGRATPAGSFTIGKTLYTPATGDDWY